MSEILQQSAQLESSRAQIAILDFGSQYSHLIARRVRQLNVFCELYSCLVDASVLGKNNLVGVILSGGPASVYDEGSPHVHASVWQLIEERKLPVLGICYGMQEIAHVFGGQVSPSAEREFGRALIEKTAGSAEAGDILLQGVTDAQMWMSHGDKVTKMPTGFIKVAHTSNSEHAAIANPSKNIFGLQFHPEVTHSVQGLTVLKNFVVGVCNAPQDWNMRSIADEFVAEVRAKVGPTGQVIGAVSGGVDSSVAAVLLHRAIGDRFHAVMVDNGLLRKDEAKKVESRLKTALGINLTVVDASELFLTRLSGVQDPETKRKTIGGLFIDVFQEQAKAIVDKGGTVDFLLQGTLYPDVIESISYKVGAALSCSHAFVPVFPFFSRE